MTPKSPRNRGIGASKPLNRGLERPHFTFRAGRCSDAIVHAIRATWLCEWNHNLSIMCSNGWLLRSSYKHPILCIIALSAGSAQYELQQHTGAANNEHSEHVVCTPINNTTQQQTTHCMHAIMLYDIHCTCRGRGYHVAHGVARMRTPVVVVVARPVGCVVVVSLCVYNILIGLEGG